MLSNAIAHAVTVRPVARGTDKEYIRDYSREILGRQVSLKRDGFQFNF